MVYPQVTNTVLVPDKTPNGTLFVSIAKCYEIEPRENPGHPASLEDCARGYWSIRNLHAARGEDCCWLMAHRDGRILGVWIIDRSKGQNGWMNPSDTPKETWPNDRPGPESQRVGCELIPVDDQTWNRFYNKEVHLGRTPNPMRGYFTE